MSACAMGVDVSKLKLDVALYENDTYKTKVFNNNLKGYENLLTWLNKNAHQGVHVCLEATGSYGDGLSQTLFDKGLIVSVVNPAQIKGFAQSELLRTKTDHIDAKLIARFCKAMNPPAWKPIPKPIQVLRSLVQRLEALQDIEREELNRLEVCHPFVKSSIQKITKILSREIALIKKQISQHLNDDEDLKTKKVLLETIPGVGEATIAQVLSMQCTPERFENAKQVTAFVGLNPKHRQSGTSVRGRSHISKTGDRRLRKAFYMPAIVAKRYNPVLKAFYERLLAAGKPRMLAIVAVMRKLLVMIFGMLKSGKPFNPLLT